ncbi:hypothetical protein DFA_07676 [Cavenderia fasciculata]|uniref:EF-hand domain-containing protein n=1 Tax=Cavenderia fasciculata TaxID=261658 RepID=F4Q2S2_CACFS|nr:uncharacterized protein DFA_07676 [Cavenderia fasciculata]EGG16698.1 hypothetical protein DFA_07676 [Cavenderia fasciculata]|eukprot:XP_004355172.1 hypothetical protein DFA_07676 [Cavenderia fasciculata]
MSVTQDFVFFYTTAYYSYTIIDDYDRSLYLSRVTTFLFYTDLSSAVLSIVLQYHHLSYCSVDVTNIVKSSNNNSNSNNNREDLKMFDKDDLKRAIKSFTGTTVSDEFIMMMQKQLAEYGDQEIDFEEFRDSFLAMTRSLYPNNPSVNCSREISNPPSPPPSPCRSRSMSPVRTPTRLISPPPTPRRYGGGGGNGGGSSGGSGGGSPISSSPPIITPIYPYYVKPNPISPRRLNGSSRPRSNSLNLSTGSTASAGSGSGSGSGSTSPIGTSGGNSNLNSIFSTYSSTSPSLPGSSSSSNNHNHLNNNNTNTNTHTNQRARAMSTSSSFDDSNLPAPRSSDDEGSTGSNGTNGSGNMTLHQTISHLISKSNPSSPNHHSNNNNSNSNNSSNNTTTTTTVNVNNSHISNNNNNHQQQQQHVQYPPTSHTNLQKKVMGVGHGLVKQTSDKDLFSTLLSLNPETFSSRRRRKSAYDNSDDSDDDHHSRRRLGGAGESDMQFQFDQEWVKKNTSKPSKKLPIPGGETRKSIQSKKKKKKKKEPPIKQSFSYKIQSTSPTGSPTISSDSSSGSDQDDDQDDKDSDNDEDDGDEFEGIGWATEEFYYDPDLSNIDDLHEVISLLKEKYTLSSTRAKELERRVQIALQTNGKLEEDKSHLQTDLIGISLKASALERNKASLDQQIDEKNSEIIRLQNEKIKEEKETHSLKKKLSHFEDILQRNSKQLQDTMSILEEKDVKHHQEIEHIHNRLNSKIDFIQKDYITKIEKEKEKFIYYCEMTEQEKYNLENENLKLKEMIETLNRQVNSLHKLYEEKQQEISLSKEDIENQTISHELLSSEKDMLNSELHNWKKRCQLMEAKKIADLQEELKRSKKEHSKFKSMLIKGIQDFQIMEDSINIGSTPPLLIRSNSNDTIDEFIQKNDTTITNNNNNNVNNNNNNNNTTIVKMKKKSIDTTIAATTTTNGNSTKPPLISTTNNNHSNPTNNNNNNPIIKPIIKKSKQQPTTRTPNSNNTN